MHFLNVGVTYRPFYLVVMQAAVESSTLYQNVTFSIFRFYFLHFWSVNSVLLPFKAGYCN